MKVARPGAKALACLEREARILWALRGVPHVPRLVGLVVRGGRFRGFVMRYLEGVTLDEVLLASPRPLSGAQTLSMAIAISESVVSVLRRGILHRDLKPQNLLVTANRRVQVLDFGLASRNGRQNGQRELSGTLAYASPEQIDMLPLTAKSDLFSLGLILYELACGRTFFDCDSVSFHAFLASRARRLSEPIALYGVEPKLRGLIRCLIVEEPRDRAGVDEVDARLARLREIVDELPSAASWPAV